MDLSKLKPNTPRKNRKRVGRGGKRGTTSGKGTKGQKSRAGAGVKPGFRGGDSRLWQLFPKQRGASKKPGGSNPHPKHRYFQLRHDKPEVLNLGFFNQFDEKVITPNMLMEKGLVGNSKNGLKILGGGTLTKKINLQGFKLSKSAEAKVLKAGGTIK